MASDNGLKVQVEGLKEFRAGLKKFAPDVAKGLARQYKAIAAMAVDKATSRAASVGGVAAHAAKNGAMKAVASQAYVAVRLDAKAEPTAFGAEFGGGRFKAGNPTAAGGFTSQFKPHKGRTGYFLYPTIRELRPDLETAFLDVIDEAAKSAFDKK